MIQEINRSAVFIAPKQAFHDMVAELSDDEAMDEQPILATDEATIYLLSADPDAIDDLEKIMKPYYKEIFRAELDGWFTDEDQFPKNITWKQFESWFHISFQSMVLDMVKQNIVREEY